MNAPAKQAPGDPVGYSDPWCAEPGGTIRFMVSTRSAAYRASLVRLVGLGAHGERSVVSDIDGQHPGRHQVARAGSCITVQAGEALQNLRSLSICLWAWPTRLGTGAEQALFSGGSAVLLIDATGLACFHIHTDHGHAEVRTERPLNERAWTLLCGSYDAQAGRLALTAREVGLYASERETVERWVSPAELKALDSTLYIAAQANTGARSTTWGISHYDGKLEAPTLYDRALSERDIDQIASGEDESAFPPDGLAAAWRFQHGKEGDRITDVGPHALHGLAINSPSRAMTGHGWRGQTQDPRINPEAYGAIHFHGDDLEDARWESDFALQIPRDLASGIYAVKLKVPEGGEDPVPFIVRPRRLRARAASAFRRRYLNNVAQFDLAP